MVNIEERAEVIYNCEEESKGHIYRTYTPADVTLIKKVAYIRGAKDEYKRLTEWREIEEDEDGFAASSSVAKILKSLPILIQSEFCGVCLCAVINDQNSFSEWAGNLFTKPSIYKWRPLY